MGHVKEWTFLPTPDLLTTASCREDWKRISVESSIMFPRWPSRSRDWSGLGWTKLLRRLGWSYPLGLACFLSSFRSNHKKNVLHCWLVECILIRALSSIWMNAICSIWLQSSVQFSALTDWVVEGTWGTIQQRSSSSFYCRRPMWTVLALAGMSTFWYCPSCISSADHGVTHPPRCPEGWFWRGCRGLWHAGTMRVSISRQLPEELPVDPQGSCRVGNIKR